MLDGTYKSKTEQFWQAIARSFVRAGFSPNQVTWIGLFLVLGNCALYAWHRTSFWFGLGLVLSFIFDALDGAVARLSGRTSKYGGYLDAVIDRYQEILVYAVIAWVTGWWEVAFLALSGSLMVSYNKARTAMEIPIKNNNWPDLMERFERLFVLCAALILDSFIPLPALFGGRLLFAGMLVIGVLSHATAIQRFYRARALLRRTRPDD
jgi:phosphatidylglycerophosphate synthase